MQTTATQGQFSRRFTVGTRCRCWSWFTCSNFIDRSILGILVQPIKEDLGVSDTMMGFLGGIAFAAFYTVLGIPIARLADKGSRVNVIAVSLTLWSGATALCGMALNFWHLLAARIGVAVGEAGGSPPSHSMISDMFPPERRATALAIYALGIPIGTQLGNLGGGWINEAFDWRTAFIVVGLPGVCWPSSCDCRFANRREAGRRGSCQVPMHRRPFSRYSAICGRAGAFALCRWAPRCTRSWVTAWGTGYRPCSIAATAWAPVPWAQRCSGWVSLPLPALCSGATSGTSWRAKDPRWYVWLPGLATLISIPFSAFGYLYGEPYVALWVMSVHYFLSAYYLGPTFSMTQGMVGLRMRALAASVSLFILNIIGLGLGPQFTGILSDLLHAFTDLGADSLRWALVFSLVFNLLSTGLYLTAGRTLKQDLAAGRAMDAV